MKKALFLILAFTSGIVPVVPASAEFLSQLPRTGQTQCFDKSTYLITPCSGTGEDGELQKGLAWPNPRFTKPDGTSPINGNVVVVDQLTGLMWTNASLPVGKGNWSAANSFITQMNSGAGTFGYTDWRLPNRNELASLAYNGENDAAVWFSQQGIPYAESDLCYLSSTTDGQNTANVWCIDLRGGAFSTNKSSAEYYIWPVRGTSSGPAAVARTAQTTSYASRDDGDLKMGVAWPTPRFASNGDFTLTDKLTGLIWTQDGNAPGPDICRSFGGWDRALNYVACLNTNNFLGHNDWRLPNVNELSSLVWVNSNSASVLNTQGFSNVQQQFYFTSTSDTAAGAGAIWAVSMTTGNVNWGGGNDGTIKAWPVRGPILPRAAVSPATYAFGNISTNSTGNGAVTISNTGTTVLTVSGIELTGTDKDAFSIIPGNGTGGTCGSLSPAIAAGTSCTIGISFTPATAGAKAAALAIASNDPATPTKTVELKGSGVVQGYTAGICGPSNGGAFVQTPSDYLCLSTGLQPTVSGTGPWSWTCTGSGGGADASCGATLQTWTISSRIPRTGQTSCYDTETGALTSCSGSGQDGELQKGIAAPNPRFTKPDGSTPINGNVVVVDQLTGLMWTNAALPIGKTTWSGANNFIAQMNSGAGTFGYTDWRLPNRNELASLAYYGENDVATWFTQQGLPNIHTDFYYFSSTTNGQDTTRAWTLTLGGRAYSELKSNAYSYVWPVRGTSSGPVKVARTGQTVTYAAGDDGDLETGTAWPSPRFVSNGDFTLSDKMTGLIWTQDANGPGPVACRNFGGWDRAFKYIACLNSNNYLGHNDWRMPNVNEMKSLVTVTAMPALALNNQGFVNVQQKFYFTSTTDTIAGAGALLVVGMHDGSVNWDSNNDGTAAVWPVRGPIIPKGSVSPQINDFGNVTTNSTSATGVITISNTGNAVLSVAWMELSGADWRSFSVDSGDGTGGTCGSLTPIIAAGGACTLSVTFRPTTVGPKSASLHIFATDSSVLDAVVTLQGTGAAPSATTVTVQVGGTGSGTVNSIPSGLSCSAGACSHNFDPGETVSLVATASAGSRLTAWSGDCTGTGSCSFAMNAAKNVNAAFDLVPPARIAGTQPEYYENVQSAYNAATGGQIHLQEGIYLHTLTAGRNIAVKVIGGYNSEYSLRPGETSLKGPMLIRSGTVRVDRILMH